MFSFSAGNIYCHPRSQLPSNHPFIHSFVAADKREFVRIGERVDNQLKWMVHQNGMFRHDERLKDFVSTLKFYEDKSTTAHSEPLKLLVMSSSLYCYEAAFFKSRLQATPDTASSASSALSSSVQVSAITPGPSHTCSASLTRGYIDSVSSENWQCLSERSADDSDFVFIKESVFRFSQPFFLLYEMLRVANKAVMILEAVESINFFPSNQGIYSSLLRYQFHDSISEQGYNHFLSVREIFKLAIGFNCPFLAIKGENDPNGYDGKMKEYREKVAALNQLGKAGERPFNLFAAILFKVNIEEKLQHILELDDWLVYKLPKFDGKAHEQTYTYSPLEK